MATPGIVIIGAGMSGLCLAIRLKLAGIESFTILEKSDDLGGVWRDNTYPGAGCDIPSFLYSFSFAPKREWKRRYARQGEIREYLRDCAERFGILEHIEFGTSVAGADFDEDTSLWRIRTADGGSRNTSILVSAVGQLSRPHIPGIEGLDSFSGAMFHSARWNHDFDFRKHDIAVIGNAASAVQFIPRLAAKARKVTIFQRSPNWISRFPDKCFPAWTRRVLQVPCAARLYRWWLFWRHEWRILLNGKSTILNRWMTLWLRREMQRRVREELRPQLIPGYAAGCKRILLSNDYLETLQRNNVELVTDPITRINAGSIETENETLPADAIVFATGFETADFLAPLKILGRDQLDLHEAWRDRPRACLGMMVPGFPNFFMLYGPNTNLAHNSIIFMVECQVNYLLRCLQKLITDHQRTIEISAEAADRFDRGLQETLQATVWTGDCTNWYKNRRGDVINNWGSSSIAYWLKTRRPDFGEFRFS